MTIATGEPAGSTMTTEPTRWSRICRATEIALASGVGGDDAGGHDLAELHGAYATGR